MYCTKCGQPRPDDAAICPNCGDRVQQFAPAAPVPNYLIQSILVTFCCCLPFGIVAVIYAAQVNSRLAAGDIAGAQQASNRAKTWSWFAFGAGAITMLFAIAVNVFFAFQEQH